MVKFLRRDAKRYSKFGKGQGKKATWRKPKGRDNKMREKLKGKPAVVKIGYKSPKKEEKVFVISNVLDLNHIKKNCIAHLKRVGKKKKIEIMEEAQKKKIKFDNENPELFIKKFRKTKN